MQLYDKDDAKEDERLGMYVYKIRSATRTKKNLMQILNMHENESQVEINWELLAVNCELTVGQ